MSAAIQDLIERVLYPGLSSVTRERVADVIVAAVKAQSFNASRIGRHMPGTGTDESKTKRVERLLYRNELKSSDFTAAVLQHISAGGTMSLVLATDWTYIGYLVVLLTCVVMGDRAVPLYWTVVSGAQSAEVEKQHLRELRALVPLHIATYVLADRGFGTGDLMHLIGDELNMHYVLRVVGNACVRRNRNEKFIRVDRIECQRDRVEDFGTIEYRKAAPVSTRLVRIHADGECEPWVLATNCHHIPPRRVVDLYEMRFRCEEFHKDLKDTRAAFGFKGAYWRDEARFARHLVLAAMTYYTCVLAGKYARYRGWVSTYQMRKAVWRNGLEVLEKRELTSKNLIDQLIRVPAAPPFTRFANMRSTLLTSLEPCVKPPRKQSETRRVNPRANPDEFKEVGRRVREALKANNGGNWRKGLAERVHCTRTAVKLMGQGHLKLPASWLPAVYQLTGLTEQKLFEGLSWRPSGLAKQQKQHGCRSSAKRTPAR